MGFVAAKSAAGHALPTSMGTSQRRNGASGPARFTGLPASTFGKARIVALAWVAQSASWRASSALEVGSCVGADAGSATPRPRASPAEVSWAMMLGCSWGKGVLRQFRGQGRCDGVDAQSAHANRGCIDETHTMLEKRCSSFVWVARQTRRGGPEPAVALRRRVAVGNRLPQCRGRREPRHGLRPGSGGAAPDSVATVMPGLPDFISCQVAHHPRGCTARRGGLPATRLSRAHGQRRLPDAACWSASRLRNAESQGGWQMELAGTEIPAFLPCFPCQWLPGRLTCPAAVLLDCYLPLGW
jgi:hypothetical protein